MNCLEVVRKAIIGYSTVPLDLGRFSSNFKDTQTDLIVYRNYALYKIRKTRKKDYKVGPGKILVFWYLKFYGWGLSLSSKYLGDDFSVLY